MIKFGFPLLSSLLEENEIGNSVQSLCFYWYTDGELKKSLIVLEKNAQV